MSSEPTTLIVPGAQAPAPDHAWDAGLLLPGVVLAVAAAGLWVALNGRRRRRIDPRELAFRRLVNAMGWGRQEVRALRRAAAARGLASPVGLALSPTLTAGVLRAEPGRRARSGAAAVTAR